MHVVSPEWKGPEKGFLCRPWHADGPGGSPSVSVVRRLVGSGDPAAHRHDTGTDWVSRSGTNVTLVLTSDVRRPLLGTFVRPVEETGTGQPQVEAGYLVLHEGARASRHRDGPRRRGH